MDHGGVLARTNMDDERNTPMPTIPKFAYTLSHPEFYESLDHLAVDDEAYFRGVRSVLPKEWAIVRSSIWYHCIAPSHTLLDQGWKIHVSAVTHNVSDTLNATLSVLMRHGVSFKFAADPNILFLLTSKQWARGGSGKFMTIYPRSTEHFHELIEELHQATLHLEGPYILSDQRYKESKCVFFRYGGISGLSELRVKGDRYAYLLSPTGEKVPDQRQAFYYVPKWIEEPAFARVDEPESEALTLNGGRYEIESALRHTNTGGVYLAIDRQTGHKVVIKEARPKTNVDVTGAESLDLLRKEYRLLQKLADQGIGPRPIDFFEEWEHSFLVEEFLDGATIRNHAVLHNVTRTVQPTKEHAAEFYAAFKPVFTGLSEVVRRLAASGVVFRDLSPTNVLLLKDGSVRLVDFEAASEVGIDQQSNLYTPGFASADIFTADTLDFANDMFSVGALMFAYFMPIHAAFGLSDTVHMRFISMIGKEYGLPESLVNLMLSLLDKDAALRPTAADVIRILENPTSFREPELAVVDLVSREEADAVVHGIVRHTLHHARVDRADRLFPSDPTVFVTNPLSVGYGACGVAMALNRLVDEVPDSIRQWILGHPVTSAEYPPGHLVGMSGIAWTLLDLGHEREARAIIVSSRAHPMTLTFDLAYGLAGQGLASLRFHAASAGHDDLAHAIACGDQLLRALSNAGGDVGRAWVGPDGPLFGLMRGASGIALFLLYLHLATADESYLEAGRQALDFDMSMAVPMDGGLLWPNRVGAERAVVPYFEFGGVGVGAVLLRYHRLTGEDRYLGALMGIKRSAIRRYTIFPQKAFGLAGLGDFLIDMANHGIDEEECMAGAHKVARGVMLFQLEREGEGIAYPGDELWKISCDYFTGSTGIALFIKRLYSRASPEFFLDELFDGARGARLVETHALEA